MRDQIPFDASDYAVPRNDDNAERRAYENRITQRVDEIFQTRRVIEQAKGMLGVVYGLDAEQAFVCLVRLSQGSHQKVNAVAMQIVTQFPTLSGPQLPGQSIYDAILLSIAAHPS